MRRRQIATVLVGPSALLREGLDRILRGTDFRIVQSVAAVEELQNESLTRQQSPLLVIECEDDVGSSVAAIKHFKLDHPSARIAVLAGSPSIDDLKSKFASIWAVLSSFFVYGSITPNSPARLTLIL